MKFYDGDTRHLAKGWKLQILVSLRVLGAHYLKVSIINGPVKLLLFTCKIEVSIVVHLARTRLQVVPIFPQG